MSKDGLIKKFKHTWRNQKIQKYSSEMYSAKTIPNFIYLVLFYLEMLSHPSCGLLPAVDTSWTAPPHSDLTLWSWAFFVLLFQCFVI